MVKVSVAKAAMLMNKGQQFVRIALQRGLVPFGFAVKLDEKGTRFDYYINPRLFCDYLGISEQELVSATAQVKEKKGEDINEPLFT